MRPMSADRRSRGRVLKEVLMRTVTVLALAICALTVQSQSQVLAPAEIKDEGARGLQQKYLSDLRAVADVVRGHNFPYHFYFSRAMDLSEQQQQSSDQRSLQFDRFQGELILKITGNYFASYSAEAMDGPQRARQTFTDVMLPILRAAIPKFQGKDVPASYALEISHHVRKKLLGVSTEKAENVVLVLPKDSANDLVAANDLAHQNAALLNASAFLDGKPLTFWPSAEPIITENRERSVPSSPPVVQPPTRPNPTPAVEARPVSGEITLEKLQERNRADLDRMMRELDSQAHFVTYAAPAFIEFHHGHYLQLSVITTLPDQTAGSQYQLAAWAFDEHIAHLIRPVLSYLKNARDFDGIDFSTTVRIGKDEGSASNLAVEYMFPLTALLSYEGYDSTGQQLIDGSFVLINGERISLNLQAAENR
jgi:hypothetical protein